MAFLLLVIAVVAQCVVPEEFCSSVVTVVQTNDVWCVIVSVVAGFARRPLPNPPQEERIICL